MTHTWTQEPRLYDVGAGNNWWPISKVSGDPDRLQAAVFGTRSDGERFFIAVDVDINAGESEKARAVAGATKRLDTFLS